MVKLSMAKCMVSIGQQEAGLQIYNELLAETRKDAQLDILTSMGDMYSQMAKYLDASGKYNGALKRGPLIS